MSDKFQMMLMKDELRKAEVFKLADLIIETRVSLRAAAKICGMGKSKACDLINNELEEFSPQKYMLVRKILDEHKTTKTLSESDIKRIRCEYEMLLNGYTLTKISEITGESFAKVQRDLANRLDRISDDMCTYAKKKLTSNKQKILGKKG